MARALDDAVDAFLRGERVIARRNKLQLASEDEWVGPESINVESVIQRFQEYPQLALSDNSVAIPLHEKNSAELTGEYIRYTEDSILPAFVYYDTEYDREKRIDKDQMKKTQLAWQLRYWTVGYNPDETPSFESSNATSETPETLVTPQKQPKPERFFNNITEFLDKQEESDRDARRSAFSRMPFSSFVQAYGGIFDAIPVSQVGSTSQHRYEFVIPSSDDASIPVKYGIYPGNEVILATPESESRTVTEPVEAHVERVFGETLELSLCTDRLSNSAVQGFQSLFRRDETTFNIGALFNSIPYDRERKASELARKKDSKRTTLTERDPVSFSYASRSPSVLQPLNESQSSAAKHALAADDIFCIHGPPGTGKTRTLVAIIRALVNNGNRVLACTHSNQAIDNLIVGSSVLGDTDNHSLHRAALDDEMTVSRVGTNVKDELVKAHYARNSPETADVVASTMSSAAQFNINEFDVAVVDEASQASIPATLIPFNNAEKTILAGDHKQLPPYSSLDLQSGVMEISLFEHIIELYGDGISEMLRTQYRMNSDIAAFPSTQFYNGNLKTADQNRDWQLNGFSPVEAFDINGTEQETASKSYKNKTEARLVAKQVEVLKGDGVDVEDIGVITPYAGQIQCIRESLKSLTFDTSNMKVDTVDSFQGSENEAIIVSFVRSNTTGNSGFLTMPDEGPRRLNVALTRAKKRVVLIGNWDTLTTSQNDDDTSDVYQSLEQWLETNGFMRRPKARVKSRT